MKTEGTATIQPPARPPEQLTSIHKAFHVLEFLATRPGGLALSEVADACDLPKSSAVRLLRTLQDLGYADRPRGTRNYCLGPNVARLAGADPHENLRTNARPLIEHLFAEFNETVNLGVLCGQRIAYVDYIETTRPLRMIVAPGSNDPWFRTALGRAIATSLPTPEREALLDATEFNGRGADQRPITRKSMAARLDDFRTAGFAEEMEEAVEGVGCLAVSLDGHGFPLAAISLAVPIQRLGDVRRQQITAALRRIITRQPKPKL